MEWKIVHLDETDSTNRWVKERATEGPMVVVADYQTAGKGCGTNTWESERGKNLLFSMLVHPAEMPSDVEISDAGQQFRITEIVSVALAEVLERYINKKVEIKWPNDIYVDDRKICGILIENRLQGSFMKDSIIGIGLNVNQQVFRSDAPNPVSLWQISQQEADREELLAAFLATFTETWSRPTVDIDYRSRLYRRTGEHLFEDKDGVFTAKVLNVLEDGRLVLLDKEGTARIYAFKEIQFIH